MNTHSTKPCAHQRENIALEAAGVLPGKIAEQLKEHLCSCAGCRDYAFEMEIICREQSAGTALEPAPGEEVWARTLDRLQAVQRPERERPGSFAQFPWLRLSRWTAALGTCLVLGIFWISRVNQPVPVPSVAVTTPTTPTATKIVISPERWKNQEPTLIAYRLALNHSMEDLDRLLAWHEPQFLNRSGSVDLQSWLANPE